jgi:magnesium transporter
MPERRRSTIRSLVRSRRPPAHRHDDITDGHDASNAGAGSQGHVSRIVDSAIYVDGARVVSPGSLADTYAARHHHPEGMAWIAVEDAIVAHQRPKLERYGDTLFVVLRPARYLDETEEVEFGEIHVFVGPDFVLTVRHSEAPDFGPVRRRLESQRDLLRLGPEAVLYAIVDRVVDGYYPVVAGVGHDIDEIEIEVFSGDPQVSRRIYELSREVAEFQRATRPLTEMLAALTAGFDKYGIDEELQRYLRDVDDHLTQICERVDEFRQVLRDMLTVNATLVAQQQNEEMKNLAEAANSQNEEVKKISAWAAILFAPTLIGTVYGMNFENMPELGWAHGYPFALFLMAATCITLYTVFKRRGWL